MADGLIADAYPRLRTASAGTATVTAEGWAAVAVSARYRRTAARLRRTVTCAFLEWLAIGVRTRGAIFLR